MDLTENCDQLNANANDASDTDVLGTKTTPSPITPRSASRTPLAPLSENELSPGNSPWQRDSRQVSFTNEDIVHMISPQTEPSYESIECEGSKTHKFPEKAPNFPSLPHIPDSGTFSFEKDSKSSSKIAFARAHFERLANTPDAKAPTPGSASDRLSQPRNLCNVTRHLVGSQTSSAANNFEPVYDNQNKEGSEENHRKQGSEHKDTPVSAKSGESVGKTALANHIRKSDAVNSHLKKMKEITDRIPSSAVHKAKTNVHRGGIRLPKGQKLDIEGMSAEFSREMDGVESSLDASPNAAKKDGTRPENYAKLLSNVPSNVAAAPLTMSIPRFSKKNTELPPTTMTIEIPRLLQAQPNNDGLCDTDEDNEGNVQMNPRSLSDVVQPLPRRVSTQDRVDYVNPDIRTRIPRAARSAYGSIPVVQVDAGVDGSERVWAPRSRSDLRHSHSQSVPFFPRRARSSALRISEPEPMAAPIPGTNSEITSQIADEYNSGGTKKSSNQQPIHVPSSIQWEHDSTLNTIEMMEHSARTLSGCLAAHTIEEQRRSNAEADMNLRSYMEPRAKSFNIPRNINRVMREGFNNAYKRMSRSESLPRTMTEMEAIARNGDEIGGGTEEEVPFWNMNENDSEAKVPGKILFKCHWKRKWVSKAATIRSEKLHIDVLRTRGPKWIRLREIRRIEPVFSKDSLLRFCFQITTYKRTYLFAAETSYQRNVWVEGLRNITQELLDKAAANFDQ